MRCLFILLFIPFLGFSQTDSYYSNGARRPHIRVDSLTANKTDSIKIGDKMFYATPPTLTEAGDIVHLSHLNTQLNGKADLTGDTFTGDISVPDEVYGVGWNASVEVPTKNALYDKIETIDQVAGNDREIQFNNAGVFGANSGLTYSPSNGFASGSDNIVSGAGAVGMGFSNVGSSSNSMALGENVNSTARAAVALGYENWSEGIGAMSINYHTQATGRSSFAGGEGVGAVSTKTGKEILASGISSFNFSYNTTAQTTGHGAKAIASVILGGQNHNLDTGNYRAAIIGGDAIKLPADGYTDNVVVPNLAIWSSPATGTASDSLLVWDATDKKVKKVLPGGGAVSSVFGRTGAVVAQSGDYTAAQVTNAFDKTADDAADVPYTPTTTGDWPGNDPNDVEEGLDSLASRVTAMTGNVIIKADTINLNGWNMDTDAAKSVTFPSGITRGEVLWMSGSVFHDNGTSMTFIPNVAGISNEATEIGFSNEISSASTSISVFRITGSRFDSVNYDDDTFNRGYVVIFSFNQ